MEAENIAGGQSSAAAVMTSWMNSAGHRANILTSYFKTIELVALLRVEQCSGYSVLEQTHRQQ